MRKVLFTVAVACLLCQVVTANEAVSALNAKLEGLYGNIDGGAAKGGAGSVSLPIGTDFGIQFDGLFGEINPDDVHGAGLHAFWRDSSVGLIGLTAGHAELGKNETNRFGLEGEYYLEKITFTGNVGHQGGDIDASPYAGVGGQYYLTDNTMVSGLISTSNDLERYALGFETQTSVRGLSLFASLATGENHYEGAFLGLRFYFSGDNKSLIRRHREDDPVNSLWGTVTDLFMSKPTVAAPVIMDN
ncbi:MAG: hypothetical protein K9N55_16430 [Phycisphaerae bacterium]|nr:hypothetical protein [Phycisphaerae bacterium]